MKHESRRKLCQNLVMSLMLLFCASLGRSNEERSDPAERPLIQISIGHVDQDQNVMLVAQKALLDDLRSMPGIRTRIGGGEAVRPLGRITLEVNPKVVQERQRPVAESYRLTARADGSFIISGADAAGALWGVRDFVHYYAKDWLKGLTEGKPFDLDRAFAPALQVRGLWSWFYGCLDPYGYMDRASENKLNTIIFWNRGVPMNAEALNEYAHERGVKIWWGFGWGWNVGDFTDANPALYKRLMAVYDRQKKRIGKETGVLCPQDPETPQALMDYVLDVYEHQYAWIPNIDGIYFQTATETVCPCEKCKAAPRGEGFIRTVLPIIKELHKRYPKLKISCGVHNTGDEKTFAALKRIPPYANICWESGVTWGPNMEVFKQQITYRGADENIAGIYRITMACGMVFRGGGTVMNEPDRAWLPRIEGIWNYIEENQPASLGKGYRLFDNKGVGFAATCSSDWRPEAEKGFAGNANFQELHDWSRVMAEGPGRTKGVFLLVEAGLYDLKMRRVPSIAAEVIWNPLEDEKELERRCDLIWRKEVGGWREPANPYWKEPLQDAGQAGSSANAVRDNGAMYQVAAGGQKGEQSAEAGRGLVMRNEAGKEEPLELTGPWRIEKTDGATLQAGGGAFALAGPAARDLELAAEMKIVEGRVGGLIFRYQDKDHYDLLNFYTDGKMVYWYRMDAGQFTPVAAGVISGDFKNGQWYPLRVAVTGEAVEATLGGKEVFKAVDPVRKAAAGRFGLHTESGAVSYRRLTVKAGGAPKPSVWKLALR